MNFVRFYELIQNIPRQKKGKAVFRGSKEELFKMKAAKVEKKIKKKKKSANI